MSIDRRRGRLAAAVALILLSAGCTVGDIRRPVPARPPTSASSTPAASPRPQIAPDEERHVAVPAGYRRDTIVFADAKHGYMTFVCHPGRGGGQSSPACPLILASTSDGGSSWQRLHHPQPDALEQELVAADRSSLVLRSGSDFYVSTDRGKTFARQPVSRGLPAVLRPQFRLCCESSSQLQVEEWVKGRYQPLPLQPPVPGLSALGDFEMSGICYDAPGEGKAFKSVHIWAAGISDGVPYAALSDDGGKAWQQTPVPAPEGELVRLRLEVFDDRAWLIGFGPDLDGFPYLWRSTGGHWERVAAEGHPEKIVSLAVFDIGVAVTGPGGGGVVAAGFYNDLGWPLGNHVEVLDDGTLFSVHDDGSFWLGEGRLAERRWIKFSFLEGARF